jgi:hypothetical protein
MPPTAPDELDTEVIAAACVRRVAAIDPGHVPAARRLLERLEPGRWTLEWYLPLWLGNAFGLDRRISTEIVGNNVLGLASLRLRDDLIDGDIAPGEIPAAAAMGETLLEASIRPYRSWFPPRSRFWRQLDRWMAEWRVAIETNDEPEPAPDDPPALDLSVADLGRLARRGAPLKISAYAVCLLTKRTAAFPTIARSLDHALTAMVLYDHVCDWEADLAGGRWNAFVAVTGVPQPAEGGQGSTARARVLAAMLAGNAIETTFARIRSELELAVAACDLVSAPALSAHLAGLANQLDAEGSRMRARYGELGDRAAAAMFGDHPLAKRGMLRGTTP